MRCKEKPQGGNFGFAGKRFDRAPELEIHFLEEIALVFRVRGKRARDLYWDTSVLLQPLAEDRGSL